jgi:hypothetical protein
MTVPDLRPVREIPLGPNRALFFDETLDRCALSDDQGRITVVEPLSPAPRQ